MLWALGVARTAVATGPEPTSAQSRIGDVLDRNYDQESPPAPHPITPYKPTTHRIRLHRTIPYTGQDVLPDGYQLERTWQSYLIVPSAFVLGTAYFLSFAAAEASGFAGPSAALVIPLFGPFDAVERRAGSFSRLFPSDLPADEALVRTTLLVDGVAQVIATVLLADGAVSPRFALTKEITSVHVAPIPVSGGYGVVVRATY